MFYWFHLVFQVENVQETEAAEKKIICSIFFIKLLIYSIESMSEQIQMNGVHSLTIGENQKFHNISITLLV